jgi:hypothetical protein
MYCPRMVSTVSYYTVTCNCKLTIHDRCRAFHENLDDKDLYERRRTKELTEALINTYEVPVLWKDHGIISDVIVRFIATNSFFLVSY